MKMNLILSLILMINLSTVFSSSPVQKDVFETSSGKLSISIFGHASLVLEFNNYFIYVDPCNAQTDYSKQPKADLVLVTHEHQDHLDKNAIADITKQGTQIICNPGVFDILKKGIVLKNGEHTNWKSINIDAVPAYNATAGRERFHPKGRDNGYVLTIGNKKIYIAGDTEDITEMSDLRDIDIAILPMNQPYTMTPEQIMKCISILKPSVIFPYHTSEADVKKLQGLIQKQINIDLRIRTLK